MKKIICGLAILLASSFAAVSQASINLNFDDVASFVSVDGFYNGGTSSDSLSGPNLGVDFLAGDWITTTGFGETSEPNLAYSAGGFGYVNVAAGFSNSFSFTYGAFIDSVVNVYDGLNGTGTLLGSFSALTNDPNAFDPATINFAGTALSVSITSAGGQFGWDDLSFGSNDVVPEPGTLMIWTVFAGTGLIISKRRRQVV